MSFEQQPEQAGEKKPEKTYFIPEMVPDEEGVMKLSHEQLLDLSYEDLKRAMNENAIRGVQFAGVANIMTPDEILKLKKDMQQ